MILRNGTSPFQYPKKYVKDEKVINGISEYLVNIKEHIQICDSSILEKVDSGDPKITQLNFVNFQPGSVVAIRYIILNSYQIYFSNNNLIVKDFTKLIADSIAEYPST